MIEVEIPTPTGRMKLEFETGQSVLMLGHNGAGKSRLGHYIHQKLHDTSPVRRIGAHRTLNVDAKPDQLDPDVVLRVLSSPTEGWAGPSPEPAITGPQNEFNFIIAGLRDDWLDRLTNPTRLEELVKLWNSLMAPSRELRIGSRHKLLEVNAQGQVYEISTMSDGERFIIYLVGQALLAKRGSLLIVDEPETHINRAILSRLWDGIESLRPDCTLLYLTHDLDFGSSRRSSTKIIVENYLRNQDAESWELSEVPNDTDLPEDLLLRILGSRRLLLFVEGTISSLDLFFYRAAYPDRLVIPLGSCAEVNQTVSNFRKRAELHRFDCAGIIDSDGKDAAEVKKLRQKHVYALDVPEVENLVLLPDVFKELCALRWGVVVTDAVVATRMAELEEKVYRSVDNNKETFYLRYIRRRLKEAVLRVNTKSTSPTDACSEFEAEVKKIEPNKILRDAQAIVETSVRNKDYSTLIKFYKNKDLFHQAARTLGFRDSSGLESMLRTEFGQPG
ncbi:MAG: AAA family ATPase, partial [Candidatus Eremiobacteraeota bacterium]|nr:AAA family ATPase [Candidatus Eremiobacteraeota bacterium]